ncbi:DciA family protein [Embleya sp. NPDC005575]|uniref:DciA family protein n=1 Tax=Embleya sp. NPDC005575 TaxID=3156892 RepID=UPI0033B2E373
MTAPTEDARPQDLARIALRSTLVAARDRDGTTATKRAARARFSPARVDDRDPHRLDGLLRRLLVARGWTAPVAGGTITDQWPRIAPEYADHVRAGHYDPQARRLDLHPTSSTFATQLRLIRTSLIARINAVVGADTVRTLRVIPSGSTPCAPAPRPAAHPSTKATTQPPQRRETAPTKSGTPHPQTTRETGPHAP